MDEENRLKETGRKHQKQTKIKTVNNNKQTMTNTQRKRGSKEEKQRNDTKIRPVEGTLKQMSKEKK